MLKIVVYDGGWGGEVVANFLSSELQTVEIIKVSDWQNAPYETKSFADVQHFAEQNLAPFINKVDAIVLGGYLTSTLLGFLRQTYPQQIFVGVSIDYRLIPANSQQSDSQIVCLMSRLILKTPIWTNLQRALPDATLIAPDCSGWEELIEIGAMSSQILRQELSPYFFLPKNRPEKRRPSSITSEVASQVPSMATSAPKKTDLLFTSLNHKTPASANLTNESPLRAQIQHFLNLKDPFPTEETWSPFPASSPRYHASSIVILNTHYWDLQDELSETFGRHIPIIDFRQRLLHDLCLALKLRGLDGRLGRHA